MSKQIGFLTLSDDGTILEKCDEQATGEITIPNSVTEIGDGAFRCCAALISISIPDSVKKIGTWAFAGCSGLTSVTISNSVTTIGCGAFENCASLTDIVLPEGLKRIESFENHDVFEGCTSLEKLVIPDSIESLKGVKLSHIEYGGWKIDCQSGWFSVKRENIGEVLCARLKAEFDNEVRMYIPSFVTIMDMHSYDSDSWGWFYEGNGKKFFIPNSVSKIIYKNTDRAYASSRDDYQSSQFYIDNYIENVEIVGANKRCDRHFFFRAPQPNTKVDGKTLELTLASNNFHYRSNGLWSTPITIHSEFVAYITPMYMECFGELEHEGCRILLLGHGGECKQCEQGFPCIDVWESYETVLRMLHKADWHKR